MPTDLERQLPRFAEALDREAPTISVDEILGRGSVAVDVDLVARPSWDQAPRDTVVSRIVSTPNHDGNGEHGASVELVPAVVARPPARRRVVLKVALGAAAAAVLVVALGAVVRTGDEPDTADVPPSTVPTPTTTVAVDPFVAVWMSTDTDGSSQTMEITRSGTDDYDVVIRDEAATTACAGGASTLTGAGRLATDTSLVIAQPELTCDDGTIPPIGTPPQAELANFTLDLDTATGRARRQLRVVWLREGSNVDLGRADDGGAVDVGWDVAAVDARRGACRPGARRRRRPRLHVAGRPATDAVRGDDHRRQLAKSNSSTGSSVRCWAGRRTCSTHAKARPPDGADRWRSARPAVTCGVRRAAPTRSTRPALSRKWASCARRRSTTSATSR